MQLTERHIFLTFTIDTDTNAFIAADFLQDERGRLQLTVRAVTISTTTIAPVARTSSYVKYNAVTIGVGTRTPCNKLSM